MILNSTPRDRVKELEKQLACLTEWVQNTIETDHKLQSYHNNYHDNSHNNTTATKHNNNNNDKNNNPSNENLNHNSISKNDEIMVDGGSFVGSNGDERGRRSFGNNALNASNGVLGGGGSGEVNGGVGERFGRVVGRVSELKEQCEDLRIAHQHQMNEV